MHRAGQLAVRKLTSCALSRLQRLRANWTSARRRFATSVRGAWARLRCYLGRPENHVVGGIVLLGAVLRLGHLDLIPFRAEQARLLLQGLRIADGLLLPLVGVGSADGIAEPPGMSFVVAFPLLLGRDPRIVAAFLSLLNVAAVLGCYRLARRYYGVRPAIVSAGLFASNPWAVLVAREVTPASALVPLSVLLAYGLYTGLLDRRPWGWVLAWAALGLMLNVTLSSLPLVAVVAVLMIAYRRRVRWRQGLLGLFLAAITLVPYVYYQSTHQSRDILALIEGLGQRAGRIVSLVRAIEWAGWIHSGYNLSSLAGASASQYLPTMGWLALLDELVACAFQASLVGLVSLAMRAWSRWKERQDPAKYLVLAVWLWVPLLVSPTQMSRLAPHSLVILWPAGFLAMGVVVDWSIRASNRHRPDQARWRILVQLALWAGVLLVVAWQTYSVMYLQGFVAGHDTAGGYGVPYRFWRSTANMVRRRVVATGTDQAWIVAQGSNSTSDEQPSQLSYLLEPEVKTVFLGHGSSEALLLPAAQPGVYLLMRSSDRIERTISLMGGEDRGLVIFPGQELRARLRVVTSHPAEEILGLIDNRTFEVLDSGLCLLGYTLPSEATPGEVVSFASYWAFLDIPPQEIGVPHSLFNHLHASTGPLVAQCYGFGLHERYWSPGLVLVQWFDMPLPGDLPEGDYALLTGMYRLADLSRNRWIDDLGNDIGDAIRLGTLSVTESTPGHTR
ncbi:MAG TPA: glycosyltransferase family 39 protein [Anaerolineae bacterium]|nr:glycosyltransferase family 39 protein [Anaerolineae bacterium]